MTEIQKKNKFRKIQYQRHWRLNWERKKEKKDASIESGFSVQIILGTVVAPHPHLPYPSPLPHSFKCKHTAALRQPAHVTKHKVQRSAALGKEQEERREGRGQARIQPPGSFSSQQSKKKGKKERNSSLQCTSTADGRWRRRSDQEQLRVALCGKCKKNEWKKRKEKVWAERSCRVWMDVWRWWCGRSVSHKAHDVFFLLDFSLLLLLLLIVYQWAWLVPIQLLPLNPPRYPSPPLTPALSTTGEKRKKERTGLYTLG